MMFKGKPKKLLAITLIFLVLFSGNLGTLLRNDKLVDNSNKIQDTKNIEKNTNFQKSIPSVSSIIEQEYLEVRYEFESFAEPGYDSTDHSHDATVYGDFGVVYDSERGNVLEGTLGIDAAQRWPMGDTFSTMFWYKEYVSSYSGWHMLIWRGGQFILAPYGSSHQPNAYDYRNVDGYSHYSQPTYDMRETDDGNWHHFAAVGTGVGTTEWYVDGVYVGASDYQPQATDEAYAIGGSSSGSYRFAQYLDDFRFYSTSLTSDQIFKIYMEEEGQTWYNGEDDLSSWNFRVPVRTISKINTTNNVVSLPINLTDKLADIRLSGEINYDSIRVAEWNEETSDVELRNTSVSAFTPYSSNDPLTNAAGEITFNMTGESGPPAYDTDGSDYITDWVIAGPYNTSSAPDVYGWDPTGPCLANVTTNRYYSNGSIANERIFLDHHEVSADLDLDAYFTDRFGSLSYDDSCAYIMTYIFVPDEVTNARMQGSFDDGIRIYLDRSLVFEQHAPSGDFDEDLGTLSPGYHSFLTMVENNVDAWSMKLKIVDATGSSIDGLKVLLRNTHEYRTFYVYFNITDEAETGLYGENNFGDISNQESTTALSVEVGNLESPKLTTNLKLEKPWWNTDWLYRKSIDISAFKDVSYVDKLVEYHVDFTQAMTDLNFAGTFDENSIRIIEWDAYNGVQREIPYQFDKDDNYNAEAIAAGTVSWIMDGKTVNARSRKYFLYFDSIDYGEKALPDYTDSSKFGEYASISNLSLSINNFEETDFTIENDKIKISLCLGLPAGADAYNGYSHIYEVVDKRREEYREVQAPDEMWGWNLRDWNFPYNVEVASNFNGISSIEVVRNGPILIVLKMTFQHPSFNYERFYTINYLDDTIEISHNVEAIEYCNYGYWEFQTKWMPGPGQISQNYDAVNSSYGIGGYDFGDDANPLFDGSSEFTSDETILTSTWLTMTTEMKQAGWFSHWDEDYNIGVGTILDNRITGTSYYDTNSLEYRTTTGTDAEKEGRIDIRIRAARLNPGQTSSYKMWGHLFNGADGTLTKLRASGIQNTPAIIDGAAIHGSSIAIVTCVDVDGQEIDGAEVSIEKSTGGESQNGYTDGNGDIIFKGLYGDSIFGVEWNISATYSVGNIDYSLFENEIIQMFSNETLYSKSIVGNLTTLSLLVIDSEVDDPEFWGLYDANVTLIDPSNGNNITSFYTDLNGEVTIRVPQNTLWNFSVQYQYKMCQFNVTGIEDELRWTHQFIISGQSSKTFEVLITDAKTKISISSITSIWGHSNHTSSTPYYIDNIYAGENVSIDFFYSDLENVGVLSTLGGWQIVRGDVKLNSSVENTDGDGHFVLTLYTEEFYTGTYYLSLNFSKFGTHQQAFYFLTINIIDFATEIERISPAESLNAYWDSDFNIEFNYTSTWPETREVSNAILYYEFSGTALSGTLQHAIEDGGVYTMVQTATLSVGSYTVRVWGNQTNYAEVDLSLTVIILANPTNISYIIPANYIESSSSLKIAHGESMNISISFTDDEGGYLGLGSLKVFVDEDISLGVIDYSDGSFSCLFNAENYSVGLHQLKIHGYYPEYETSTLTFDLMILDYWDTTLEIITPPTVYPWNNISSFVVKYSCVEQPRKDFVLADALISTLNITHKIDDIENLIVSFGSSEQGVLWDYEDLKDNPDYGEGYYLIWFDTSVVTVESAAVVYAIPSMQHTTYRMSTARPYVWITALKTGMVPYIPEKMNVESFDLTLDQSTIFSIKLNVTDEDSVIYGKDLEGASVNYQIVSRDDETQVLQSGILDEVGDGLYQFSLVATKIGEYKIKVTSSLENHTSTSISTFFNCLHKEFSLQTGLNIDNNTIFTPQNNEITFSINVADEIDESELGDVSVWFVLDGRTYNLTEDSTSAGLYSITLTLMDLESIEARNQPYQFDIMISKANYTTAVIPIAFQVGLPVDPIVGVTYRSWMIIGGTIGAMVAILATYSYIKYASIPLIIKQIDKAKKQIKGNKSVSDDRMTITKNDEIMELFEDDWKLLDIDLGTLLKTDEGIPNESITSGDEPVGGVL